MEGARMLVSDDLPYELLRPEDEGYARLSAEQATVPQAFAD
jgi:hypothetical protein